ncbi:MFS transporter [Brachybacterium sp. GCM10030267]|uniref:MFS transporter n=1 Tax=unclassified Brachybacterium TaxID=2623841 RepID=UPI00362391BD
MVSRHERRAQVRGWQRAVLVAFALGGFSLSSWATRLPAIRETLSLDNAQLGLALLAPTIGSALGLVAAPIMLRTSGARRALLVMLGAAATGIAVAGGAVWASSVAGFLVGLGIAGLGIGATDLLINIDGASVERLARRTLMPFLHAAWPAGAVLGAGIGAVCARLGIAPAAQLLGQAVLVVLAAVVLVRFVPSGSRGLRRRKDPGTTSRRRLSGVVDLRLLAIGVVMFAAEFGEGAANSWLSIAMRDALRQSEAFAAGVVGVYAAAQVLIRVAGGPLVDRFGRVTMIRACTALGALGVAAMALDLGVPLAVLGVLLWSVGVSMGFPLGMSAAAEGPDGARRASTVASVGYVANLVSPPLIGFLASGYDVLTAFWPIAGLFLLSAALAPAFRSSRRRT